jgi:hypothetical protein
VTKFVTAASSRPQMNWVKRDDETGRILDQKQDGKPFKGVRREKHDEDA